MWLYKYLVQFGIHNFKKNKYKSDKQKLLMKKYISKTLIIFNIQ